MPKDADTVIAEAAEKLLAETSTETEETVTAPESQVTEESPDQEESEGETPEEEADKLNDEEIIEAKFLYKALKNPNLRPAILTSLLEQTEKPVETKVERSETKRDIISLIKEALGPEYAFMSDKLGKAIDVAMNTIREEHQAETQRIEAERINNEVVREMEALAKETHGQSSKLEPIMMRLSEKLHPGPKTTIAEYIRTLYREASAGSTQRTVQAKTADKIRRNANDAPSRLQSASTTHQTVSGIPAKKMGLNESVEWAMKQIADREKRK
jgi:hypothetical protein